jgi:hypothetical protein
LVVLADHACDACRDLVNVVYYSDAKDALLKAVLE